MKKQSSKLLFLLKSHTLIPNIKLHLAKRLGKKEKLADPSFIFYSRCGYFPNLKDPKTFNEKITWLKNNYRNPLWQRCTNKLEMKSFLAEIGLGEYAVKTLGGPYLSSKE